MRENYETTEEFINSVKTDIFPDEIYVFTPQGEVIEMPNGSTAIDFAYAVHTDIGHHCRACRLNKKLAPLSVPLESGHDSRNTYAYCSSNFSSMAKFCNNNQSKTQHYILPTRPTVL
jgi:Guanosine polyphosphate pyrophosphohydrolases/synthetases